MLSEDKDRKAALLVYFLFFIYTYHTYICGLNACDEDEKSPAY